EVCRAEAGPIAIRIMAEEAPEFEHDPALMHQAMVNLIRNACDATRASGGDTILLSAGSGLVDPDGPDPSPGVVLRVRDEGDGFEPEAIERVFNPFFTTRAAGTGLGLPIVHRIVDAHGGAISISNNPPSGPSQIAGATVELRFPLRAARSIPEVVVAAGSRPAHALSVQELSVNEESL
ncbi:MAG: HAMP domain-containing sensor histidine kinase, partial [Planctomycetota bacterium]